MYRVGFPGWKIAARAGLTLRLRINVHFDQEAGVFWAESPDLDGLVVEGATREELRTEALAATSALLEEALKVNHPPRAAALFTDDVIGCPA